MEKDYARYCEEKGCDKKDYISRVLQSNFHDDKHNMNVKGEEFFFDDNLKKEYFALEKVDLTDYWNNKEWMDK